MYVLDGTWTENKQKLKFCWTWEDQKAINKASLAPRASKEKQGTQRR